MPARLKVPKEFEKMLQISMRDVLNYQEHEIGRPFIIEIKVPFESDKFLDDHRHFTKSNINVCYAAPRNVGKPRDWYETQLNVTKAVRGQMGYPYKGIPFFAVTDDGYGFLAHTTSENNKQFSAVGDELTLGRWLKNRLVEEGLIEPVKNTLEDTERKGMVTREILSQYGCNAISFQKTDMRMLNPEDERSSFEIWTLKLISITEDDNG